MCLILFAASDHPDYLLVLGANRDEFYSRPAAPLAFWNDTPQVLAGRDLQSLGTWLGVNRSGSFAAVTNYRDPGAVKPDAPSRGFLVSEFLAGGTGAPDYLEQVRQQGPEYNGFNLLAGGRDVLFYYSNRQGTVRKLDPGIYGLSNDFLDTPWPKVRKGKDGLAAILAKRGEIDPEEIFSLLRDRTYAPDNELPDTGAGDVWERILSPLFIESRIYGTRCSSVLLIEKTGRITFCERTFEKHGDEIVEGETVKFVIG